ncbi:MAG: RagB/SusD family nutrient uptake outer membrane protein [Tannerella sp.]|jgi:tetratricopeptide (TPR) repeat protein|nr:RagB/SusD family nutrient uptake outer membrane protein [Tannerella sp.]
MKKIKLRIQALPWVLLLALAAGLGSCSDFLDKSPTNAVSSTTIWTRAQLAEQAVTGVYNDLLWEWQQASNYWDMRSYVMDYDINWLGDVPDLVGTATSSSGCYATFWQVYYEGIQRANDVIANIGKVPDMTDADKGRYIAECKFLRAWFYMRLNMLYHGVPLYLEPVEPADANKPRSSEADVWKAIVQDLTDCINEPNLPDKYAASDANYGHVTKGAAYALRGRAYLWMKDWADAVADFKKVTTLGYALFPDYKALFKEENERCDEMIFSVQYIDETGMGSLKNRGYGSRVTDGYAWNNYIPNPHFVDSYEYADGKPFSWDDLFPGYSDMAPAARSVYFLRDSMTDAEKSIMQEYGADLSKYLPSGNEARILKAYTNRDPRMTMNIITPYSTYLGGCTGTPIEYTLRWPYRGYDAAYPYDIRTDTNAKFYYLMRKFVGEGTEIPHFDNSPIDEPLIRYADVLLGLAEALNEEGKTDEAITYVNQVRARIPGLALLNSNTYTQVKGQDDLRTRIQNEYHWELVGEDQLYFDELRWGTWKKLKFQEDHGRKNGMTEIWGKTTYTWSYEGDQVLEWAIPAKEIEMNPKLTQNPGWN